MEISGALAPVPSQTERSRLHALGYALSTKFLYVLEPIIHDGYVIGSMRVTLSHRPIVEAIQSSLQDGALLLLFLIAGGTVFYISIERLVLKPVMELNRVIENVTHGRNTEHQARYYAKDEIGDLASSFNQMM
ncbi:HAMP domain-containing protein, partial [Vibrio parahaemolyticus]